MNENNESVLYRQILENLTGGVLLFDQSFSLIYVNTTAEILLDVSARKLLGQHARKVFRCLDDSIEEDMTLCLADGTSFTKPGLQLGLPEGSVSVNCSIVPLLEDVTPKSVMVELHMVDRHMRISHEEQLMIQQDAARMLVRGLAHEIKNPLGGLRGAAQLLEKEIGHGELRDYTKIIIDESDRLRTLMDRMLGPNRPPNMELLNIHKVVERVRQLVNVEAPPGINIERDYDPSIPPLRGDRDQLIQAILNILRNAVQALGKNGNIILRTRIHRHVTIGKQCNRLAAKVAIIDDGPGIEADKINQIFYPMVTNQAAGTGLGLSIAQSLIHQHGGMIECLSKPGNTVFCVFLPLETIHE